MLVRALYEHWTRSQNDEYSGIRDFIKTFLMVQVSFCLFTMLLDGQV